MGLYRIHVEGPKVDPKGYKSLWSSLPGCPKRGPPISGTRILSMAPTGVGMDSSAALRTLVQQTQTLHIIASQKVQVPYTHNEFAGVVTSFVGTWTLCV